MFIVGSHRSLSTTITPIKTSQTRPELRHYIRKAAKASSKQLVDGSNFWSDSHLETDEKLAPSLPLDFMTIHETDWDSRFMLCCRVLLHTTAPLLAVSCGRNPSGLLLRRVIDSECMSECWIYRHCYVVLHIWLQPILHDCRYCTYQHDRRYCSLWLQRSETASLHDQETKHSSHITDWHHLPKHNNQAFFGRLFFMSCPRPAARLIS